MSETFLNGKVTLLRGDCLELLPTLEENSIDSCVTDPPYHLTSIVKRFGNEAVSNMHDKEKQPENRAPHYKRLSKGFMGKQWDGGDIAFNPELWAEVLRVLKPGAHLLAFSGTRTYHRMACAIEDVGFEIRDQIGWCYGSGFPKSHDVSKAIDRALGAEREIVGYDASRARPNRVGCVLGETPYDRSDNGATLTAPATEAAIQWQGWGTALKPSFEPLVLARKPLENGHHLHIMGSHLKRLESRLWSMLSASAAERFFGLSQSELDAASAFARWSAAERSNTQAALSGQMDMSQFELATISSLNTVSSWSGIWAAASTPENTSTTETELSTTIDLRTLRSSLSKITAESIILAHKSGYWSIAHASPAERLFDAVARRLSGTLELSALGPAIAKEAEASLDVDVRPSWNSIVLARKPLSESSIAANVLKWGTGAINVDGCRIGVEGGTTKGSKPQGEGRGIYGAGLHGACEIVELNKGRWPANLIHDGSEEVLERFPLTKGGDTLTHHNKHDHFGDEGSAARFFYTAKADRLDRIARTVEEVTVEWISEQGPSQVRLQVDTEQSPEKAIVVSGSEASSEWSTFLSGKRLTALFRQAYSCTIVTGTSSTTDSPTWNLLTDSLTSGFTGDVRYVTENGGSLAESVASGTRSVIITLARTASLPGANHATGRTQLTISVSAKRQHGHPTCKPLDLMQYLVRLVTPRGGTTLDCFAGTGTTGEAAWREGFRAVLIERELEYQADIVKRMGLCLAGPDERRAASVKQLPPDDLPMFGGGI